MYSTTTYLTYNLTSTCGIVFSLGASRLARTINRKTKRDGIQLICAHVNATFSAPNTQEIGHKIKVSSTNPVLEKNPEKWRPDKVLSGDLFNGMTTNHSSR